jgi:aldose 1-epimerase
MENRLVTITDDGGTAARILVSQGFNCFDFTVATATGPISVLWSEDGFQQGDRRASGSGIPLLFPFPGRIAGTEFFWDGQTYSLTAGDGRGNAIHGFVHERPWRVIDQATTRVVGQFQASTDDPEVLKMWPSDFCVTASYEVAANALVAHYRLQNCGSAPLPCGFGTHPYFRVPLGGDDPGACRVQLPVTAAWELADMNATGQVDELDDSQRFLDGLAFEAMQFDNVFGKLVFEKGIGATAITDPQSGRTMTMTFDDQFRELVVYTPPHRQAICIEPYTCVPDCFRLALAGIDAGLRVLTPGESFATKVAIRLD